MPFDMDVPSGGGNSGPFIQWQAKESMDGSMPGRSWSIRDASGKKPFDGFARGVIMDIDAIRTGWCYSTGASGVAPEWLWNASVKQFAPQPPARAGDARWQRGFSIPLAYGPENVAAWEQAQAGAWSAFVALVGLLKAATITPGQLPVVKHDGVEKIESKRGVTFAPKLAIVKWVPRPPILSAAPQVDAGGDDWTA